MAGKKGGASMAVDRNEEEMVSEAENARQMAAFPIRVRIEKMMQDPNNKLKAIASANIGEFAVHGIKVFENENGMYVQMPSRSYEKDGKTEYTDIFHATTPGARAALVGAVAQEYEHALSQSQQAGHQATNAEENTQPVMQKM